MSEKLELALTKNELRKMGAQYFRNFGSLKFGRIGVDGRRYYGPKSRWAIMHFEFAAKKPGGQ